MAGIARKIGLPAPAPAPSRASAGGTAVRRRLAAVARPVLVALLVAAAAAGVTLANVSLLGTAERSGDPIGKLTPSSYPVKAAPAVFRPAPKDDVSRRQPTTASVAATGSSPGAATRAQVAPAASAPKHEHRGAGRHADD